jgi:serine/threonine protein kinase/WD40 repeat protein/tetratricopeptide (TPR) repeat protein
MLGSASDRNPVECLAEEFAERQRRGEHPAITEYTSKYPQWADQIRDLFPALALIEQLKPRPDATGAYDGPASLAEDQHRERLGDYRILREVGRGGMGIVYEAEQESLGRRVALKVFPFHQLSGTNHLERFRREAKAAGRLHHTNIVPVFGVGESDGLHYYAMQFINGEGLDKVVEDLRRFRDQRGSRAPGPVPDTVSRTGIVAQGLLTGRFALAEAGAGANDPNNAASAVAPAPPAGSVSPSPTNDAAARSGSCSELSGRSEWEYCRNVARVGLQVAEALAYAHKQGILHRDIKPSNLLLDGQGTVWITDFGLAKAEGTEDLTHTGDIVGTLRYMAPERFNGKSLPQSDVYGLGLTLYELLTLRPAFEDSHRARLIEQVMHQEPAPPRKVDPRIPRDLETIILKALAKDPEQRYATADQMAEDLRRFLADRPIKARRTLWHERTWRWCRRNPLVATLIGASLLLLTVIAVGGVVMSLNLGEALEKSQRHEREGKRKLFESYVSEADAKRMSRRPGQRFGTLRSIREALKIAREVGLSDKDQLRLRNIAIAALCLPDIETGPEWPASPDMPLPEQLDPALRQRVCAGYALGKVPAPAYSLKGDTWYSPDGRFIAVATKPYVKRWDVPARVWRIDGKKPILVLEESDGPYEEATAFRPDSGQVAFGRADGTVSLYDLGTGKRAGQLPKGPGPVFCLVYHPRLLRLAVANGSEVTLWDLRTKQRLQRLRHPGEVCAIAWHPAGRRLATACHGGKNQIHFWDAGTGRPVTPPWQGHRNGGLRIAFSNAGDRVVSNDWSNVLRLWDAATGQLLVSLPDEGVLHFSSDGQSLGPRWPSGKVGVLRVAGGQELRILHRATPGASESFLSFSLHPNGRLLAVNTETGLGFFDLITGEEARFVEGGFNAQVQFDRTGALWTVGGAGLVRWPVRAVSGSPSRWRIGPPEWVANLVREVDTGFSLSADGQLAAVPLYSQGTLVVHRGPPRRTFRLGPQHDVRHVHVSPDGRWVVTGSHGGDGSGAWEKVWDAATASLVANLPSDIDWAHFHGFSPDSRWLYVSGKDERRLEIASLATNPVQPTAPDTAPRPAPGQKAWRSEKVRLGGVFSPDNRLRAYGTNEASIRLVLPDTDQEIARLVSPEPGGLGPSGFSPDGTLLLATGAETGDLYVFDLRRIRTQLAELDLDWDLPAYPPARPADNNPALTLPLEVELIDAAGATGAAKIAASETRRAVLKLVGNPFDAEAHFRLGMRLVDAGNPKQARAHLTVALALRPEMHEALYPRAQAAFRLGRWADTVADTTRCLKKYAFDARARYLRAQAEMMRKRFADAAADLGILIKTYSTDQRVYELRARCQDALGKATLAKADRERAIKLAARGAPLKNNDAWKLVTGPVGQRDPAKALKLIWEAIDEQPENAIFLNTLGVVQYHNGQYQQAVATLEKSLAAGQGEYDAFDLFFLAMSHVKLGDKKKAKEYFDRAVRWWDGKKGLRAEYVEELKMFRAEAEAMLKGK